MLVALVYAIGPISGCHVNPAVTMGFISAGRMKVGEGIFVHRGPGRRRHRRGLPPVLECSPTSAFYHKSVQGLGADGYGKASVPARQPGGRVPGSRSSLTAVFVMVVLFATHRAAIQGAAGVAIGFALVMVHLIGIPLTGNLGEPRPVVGPRPWSSAARR